MRQWWARQSGQTARSLKPGLGTCGLLQKGMGERALL